ncbi:MAG: hypothetical protein ABIF88_00985 [archaeon]
MERGILFSIAVLFFGVFVTFYIGLIDSGVMESPREEKTVIPCYDSAPPIPEGEPQDAGDVEASSGAIYGGGTYNDRPSAEDKEKAEAKAKEDCKKKLKDKAAEKLYECEPCAGFGCSINGENTNNEEGEEDEPECGDWEIKSGPAGDYWGADCTCSARGLKISGTVSCTNCCGDYRVDRPPEDCDVGPRGYGPYANGLCFNCELVYPGDYWIGGGDDDTSGDGSDDEGIGNYYLDGAIGMIKDLWNFFSD